MKTCTKCNVQKSEEFFSKDSTKTDGYDFNCKVCRAKYRRSNILASRGRHTKNLTLHSTRVRSRYKFPSREFCSVNLCNEPGERHHLYDDCDYYFIWLCREHHREIHRIHNCRAAL